MSDYTVKYRCSGCDQAYLNKEELLSYKVDIFERNNPNNKVFEKSEWKQEIWLCEQCRLLWGEVTKVLYEPYVDCQWAMTSNLQEPVLLLGSYSQD